MESIRIAGVLLIALPVAFNAIFFLLQKNFEYPDILRKPTDYILDRFNKGGGGLVALWYCFALTALLFIPTAVLVDRVLENGSLPYLGVALAIGVVAGLAQFLGLIRWTFLVPYLAKTYFEPDSDKTRRDTISTVFQAFHRYAGVAIGEHLGYLCTSVWTALIALALTQSPHFGAWIGWAGLVPAAGIFVGLFEEAGVKAAGAINAVSYVLWSVWLIVLGVAFLLQ